MDKIPFNSKGCISYVFVKCTVPLWNHTTTVYDGHTACPIPSPSLWHSENESDIKFKLFIFQSKTQYLNFPIMFLRPQISGRVLACFCELMCINATVVVHESCKNLKIWFLYGSSWWLWFPMRPSCNTHRYTVTPVSAIPPAGFTLCSRAACEAHFKNGDLLSCFYSGAVALLLEVAFPLTVSFSTAPLNRSGLF